MVNILSTLNSATNCNYQFNCMHVSISASLTTAAFKQMAVFPVRDIYYTSVFIIDLLLSPYLTKFWTLVSVNSS